MNEFFNKCCLHIWICTVLTHSGINVSLFSILFSALPSKRILLTSYQLAWSFQCFLPSVSRHTHKHTHTLKYTQNVHTLFLSTVFTFSFRELITSFLHPGFDTRYEKAEKENKQETAEESEAQRESLAQREEVALSE